MKDVRMSVDHETLTATWEWPEEYHAPVPLVCGGGIVHAPNARVGAPRCLYAVAWTSKTDPSMFGVRWDPHARPFLSLAAAQKEAALLSHSQDVRILRWVLEEEDDEQ